MKRVIVALTGATGLPLAVNVLKKLRDLPDIEIHLVCSNWAKITLMAETNYHYADLCALADVTYNHRDLSAAIASGSFVTEGMIVVPCSMKTLAAIRCGFSDNLISRAADVIIKERRKLVLVARETPLSAIHLENMLALTQIGAMIFPPTPAFYHKPETIDQMLDEMAIRILAQLNVFHPKLKEWNGIAKE